MNDVIFVFTNKVFALTDGHVVQKYPRFQTETVFTAKSVSDRFKKEKGFEVSEKVGILFLVERCPSDFSAVRKVRLS